MARELICSECGKIFISYATNKKTCSDACSEIRKRKYIDELKNLPEGKGGSFVLKKHEDELECIQVEDPLELFDVDTKEDLEMLKKSAVFF